MAIERARAALGERLYNRLVRDFQTRWDGLSNKSSTRREALAAFVQEHFSHRIAEAASQDSSPARQYQDLATIKQDIEDLHAYGGMSRTDSLTAAFGFFGDALFGTADRDAATQATTTTLDTVNTRLQGIETKTQSEPGGMNALRNGLVDDFFSHMPNEQSALRDLAHKLSDQFSAHSLRGSGEAEQTRRPGTPKGSPPSQTR
jgi:hypothetical protein